MIFDIFYQFFIFILRLFVAILPDTDSNFTLVDTYIGDLMESILTISSQAYNVVNHLVALPDLFFLFGIAIAIELAVWAFRWFIIFGRFIFNR